MKKRTILDFLSSQDTTPKKPCRKNKIEISNKENTKEIEINNKENTKEIEINNNKNKPCINKDEIKKTNKICINIKEIKETKDIDDNLLNKKHSQSNTTYNEYIPSSNESITPPIPSKNTSTKQSDRYPFLKNILDANHNPPTHPCYDPSTLYIDPTYLSTLTPFEQQFWNIKKNHFNTIVCFKKGKFYELYENDAEIGNKHFNLKLTDRVNMKMAGFPEAKFNYWAQEFLKKGYNIARIEQEENRIQQKIRLKNSNKGKSDKNKIIERKLKEIITPSTIYNYEMLPNNNIIYLCSIVKVKYNDKMRSDNNKVYNDNSNNSNDNNTITNNINNNNSNITINNNNIITNNYTISLLDCCSNKLYYTSTNDINKIIENNKIKEIITEEELEYKNIKIINTKELYNKYNYNMNNKSDINISMSDIGTISDISMNNSNNDNDGDNCNNNNNDNNNNNNNTINMNNLSTEERKSIEIIKIYLLLLNRRIDNIEILPYKHSMLIDNITIKNLNLIKDNSDNSNISNLTHTNLNTDNTDNNSLNIHNSNINTLLERIDYTLTPYGRRKLISYILSPLSSVKDILSRRILTHYIRNKDIIEIKEIEDIERVMGRLNNYKIKDIEFIIRNINKSKKILNNIIDNNGYDDGNSNNDIDNSNDNDDILDNNNNNNDNYNNNNKFNNNNNDNYNNNNVITNFNKRIKDIISEIDIFIEVFNSKYKIEEDNIIKIYNNDINDSNDINTNTDNNTTNNNTITNNHTTNITKILNKLEEYRIQEEERIGYSIKYKNIGKDIFLLEIDKNNNYKYTTEYILHSSTKNVNRYYTKDLLSLVYEYKEQLEIEYINSKHSIIECIEYIIHNSNIIYNTIDILAEIDVYRSYYEYNSISNSIYSILIDHSKIDNYNVGESDRYNNNNDINSNNDITDTSLTYTNPNTKPITNNNNITNNNIYSPIINIKGMKNPIYPSYVSNDININNTIILTGANMGGKSTLLRSICYNVILNQMGLGISIEDNNNDNRYYNDNNNICKVIDYEEYINNNINTINNNINTESNINNITNTMNNNYMSIFDKIYTRIGASDNLLEGISTFQNEMKECSTILNGITNRSLIIMDELGRGTSTVDGSAIAMSVINYISNTHSSRYNGNKIIRRPLLLFSTHYNNIIYKLLNNHNNTDSNDNTTTNNTINHTNHNNHTNTHINNIKPMYMKTLLNNNDIIFCYKLVDGVADSSLGIKVARLAGVDSKIIDRAEEILKQL